MIAEMDRLKVARRIRQLKPNRTLPIVVLTATVESKAMQHAFQAGITFFLTKPVTVEKVKKLRNASSGIILAECRRSQSVSVSFDVHWAWKGEEPTGEP